MWRWLAWLVQLPARRGARLLDRLRGSRWVGPVCSGRECPCAATAHDRVPRNETPIASPGPGGLSGGSVSPPSRCRICKPVPGLSPRLSAAGCGDLLCPLLPSTHAIPARGRLKVKIAAPSQSGRAFDQPQPTAIQQARPPAPPLHNSSLQHGTDLLGRQHHGLPGPWALAGPHHPLQLQMPPRSNRYSLVKLANTESPARVTLVWVGRHSPAAPPRQRT